ncbi:TetR/AcrR family transcriptional regulator [Granulicella mallensis]|uniref:AcrR family transcriptional regulator n=1 Tax=Granulicella mallensis TaxID=940614 RepID=A0A7W8EB91_9BACT|nr:TetR/AcrR family transcriptional regulator [Granulicella mallensis]MBB5064280.1 AcrR family transcriptional regulator [Granulicella mallensis]
MRYAGNVTKAMKQRLTRQESRLETRTRLLESAAQLFARVGYEGASVDLIAESAGYSKGAFYSNFESKEVIFLELLDAHKRREIEALAQLLAQDIPAPELLSQIRSSETIRGSDFDFGLLSAEFQLQACRDKTFAKTYAKLHRTHRDTMAGLVTKLFAKLDRKPPSDPKDLADIIMALTTGLSLQGTSMQGPLRKGFVTEAILLVLGIEPIEGDR